MRTIYEEIIKSKTEAKKLLAILLDPDKIEIKTIDLLLLKINQSFATHIFVGGSEVNTTILDELIATIKQKSDLPIVLFPGNPSQISKNADAILFLSLISGRNTDYLIEHQINAVPSLSKANLEIISTGYILIESGTETAVERVSKTKPLDRNAIDFVAQTALAGEYLGNKMIYLEAGSGAKLAVSPQMIQKVATAISIPLIVGGGIRSKQAIENAYIAGADLVVIGTAFENNMDFFNNDAVLK
jgi:putative glycerol-1-phosphate prenyltransferase